MADIKGLRKVEAAIQRLKAKYAGDGDVSAVVGFTAQYALWVHEAPGTLAGQSRNTGWVTLFDGGGQPYAFNLGEALGAEVNYKISRKGYFWDPQGQAQPQFLVGPARELANELRAMIFKAVKKGAGLAKALLLAGLRLQREAQLRTPVDTGNLKASAFTRIEKG